MKLMKYIYNDKNKKYVAPMIKNDDKPAVCLFCGAIEQKNGKIIHANDCLCLEWEASS